MQNILLLLIVMTGAAFGRFLMKKLDTFLEENRLRQKEETKKVEILPDKNYNKKEEDDANE